MAKQSGVGYGTDPNYENRGAIPATGSGANSINPETGVSEQIGLPPEVDLGGEFSQRQIRVYRVNTVGNGFLRKNVSGSLLWAISGSDSNVLVNIKVNPESGDNDPLPFRPGVSIGGLPFNSLEFSWLEQLDSEGAAKEMVIVVIKESPYQRILV